MRINFPKAFKRLTKLSFLKRSSFPCCRLFSLSNAKANLRFLLFQNANIMIYVLLLFFSFFLFYKIKTVRHTILPNGYLDDFLNAN